MKSYTSPTQILTDALGVDLPGETSSVKHVCYMCGSDIEPGCTFIPDLRMPASFTMFGEVKRNDGTYSVCTHCLPCLNAEFLRQCASVVITPKGIYRLNSGEDKAALILNPPEDGPLVAWFSNKKSQHAAWRAPISFEPRKFIFITVDQEIVCINRDLVLKGFAAWQALGSYLRSTGARSQQAGPTTVKLTGDRIGAIDPESLAIFEAAVAAGNEEIERALHALDCLGPGEWTGVYALHSLTEASKSKFDLQNPATWPHLRPLPPDVMSLLRKAAQKKFDAAAMES